MPELIIGTRGSKLALWQTRWVMRTLRRLYPDVSLSERIIKTQGDIQQTKPLGEMGGKGLFTGALDEAMLAGEIDLAVHSMKDYPTDIPEGLCLAASPMREDPHDALIAPQGKDWRDLPPRGVIGTGSLRRISQLRAFEPGWRCANIRGNLDTRLRKLDEGQYDAIVLATAGLKRLGWAGRITRIIPFATILPAVGQGILAVMSRREEARRISKLNHPPTEACALAERALLARLGGGCHVPVGALAQPRGRYGLRIQAIVAHPKENRIVCASGEGLLCRPESIGLSTADALLRQGAREILED